jgi:DNA-binding transcriptional ArsR family regulator
MAGDKPADGFSIEKGELFEALGHPTRIRILKLVQDSPTGFSDLKKALGIESSGLMQHHLRKLQGLVKVADRGNYALTDEGREALRVALAMEGDRPARRLRVTLSPALAVCILLVCTIAAVASISYLENASMRGALDAADQEMAQLNQSYTQLLSDMEHFNSQVDQQSPFLTRISKSQAIRIALAYGGWNASSLRGQTVTGTLYYVACNTSSNWRARTNVTEPAASYSPINDGEMEYFYEWYITIAGNFGNGPFQLCHTGYYIDAMNGQILGMMVADINWIL